MIAMTVFTILIMIGVSSYARWVLPVADGDDIEPSSPSVQGYLISVGNNSITLQRDTRDGKGKDADTIKLTSQTEFFSAYGGSYKPDQLRSGQYVWVWYITEDPKKAGKPPKAAVVMLWSLDPSDKPSGEVRWHFEKRK
jgi:hypothetical protein